MEKQKTEFHLLAGALLQDVENGNPKYICSNANLTDELALYHLKTNPDCRRLFQGLPENVDALIEGFVIKGRKQPKENVAKK